MSLRDWISFCRAWAVLLSLVWLFVIAPFWFASAFSLGLILYLMVTR